MLGRDCFDLWGGVDFDDGGLNGRVVHLLEGRDRKQG